MIRVERILLLGAMCLFAMSAWRPTGNPVNAATAPQGHNYVDTTICKLVTHSEQFDEELVRVRASVGSDGIEHTGLEDVSCAGKGVALWVSKEVMKDPSVAMLEDAIFRLGRPGTSAYKEIDGTFLGKFAARPKDFPPRMFYLEKVSDLTIHIKGDDSKGAGR